jgi:hypothetical protein
LETLLPEEEPLSWLDAMLRHNERSGSTQPVESSPARLDALPSEACLEPIADTAPGISALFVATNLEAWEAKPPIRAAQDRECEACGYRRLDTEYYAWLRSRMLMAQKHYQVGRIPTQKYEQLRARFNAVHDWAVASFGEQALLEAVKTLDPRRYQPPAVKDEAEPPPAPPHAYPVEGDCPATQSVSPAAIAKVNAISDQALALGWSEAQLYQNRGHYSFPYGQDYGLVCFLDDGEEVGEVTRQSIEIINARGNRLRFYNHAVDQPWLRHERPNQSIQNHPDTLATAPVSNS